MGSDFVIDERAKKYVAFALLLIIFVTAFWFRMFPAKYNELQALDPFYIFRTSHYVLTHNWQLFDNDILRAYPDGNNPWKTEYLGPIYIPAFVYALGGGWGMHYLQFGILWPALMGALAVLAMYLFSSELFGRKAGLFSAFFLATTPAYITRSSAGFFEKEPLSGFFIILAAYLFVRSYKRKGYDSIISGVFGGLSTAIAAISWGGMRYIFMVYGLFLATGILIYSALVVLDYLFSGFKKPLKTLERYMGMNMVVSFGLTIVLGEFISTLFYIHAAHLTSLYAIFPISLWALLLTKNLLQKTGILKKEHVYYFIPGSLLFVLISIVVVSLFSDDVYFLLNQFMNILTFNRGIIGSTVAENAPGNWGTIAGMIGASFAGKAPLVGWLAGPLSSLLSLWTFVFLGLALLVYRFARTLDMLVLFPFVWMLAAFWGVFYYVRLVFLLGPPTAMVGGFFASWIVTRRSRLGITDKIRQRFRIGESNLTLMSIILAFVVFLIVLVNFANAYVYSLGIGPSICFPDPQRLIDGQKCLDILPDGTLVLAKNQPWYDALQFMHDYGMNKSNNITYPPVVLTWWDFGYWFQSRAGIASVADGGAAGDRSGIARWFTDDYRNWNKWEDWLKYHKVDYILMDYTLPGKYGAISKIASEGEHIYGFLQFQRKGMQPSGNKTIVVFGSGNYEVWIPMQGQSIAGTPMFLIKQGDQYLQKKYINEICTSNGVIKVGNEEDSIPGCVAITPLGLFYIQPETENTIFTRLMFMDGAGLPVKKIYDSGLIIIYRPIYNSQSGNPFNATANAAS